MTNGQNMRDQITRGVKGGNVHELVFFASLGLAGQLVELVESKPGGKAKFVYIF